jgi:predicted branched-subunit amino acid permease
LTPAERRALIRGAAAEMLPVFLPAIPFAFVLGIVIMDSRFSPLVGWSSSPLIFGGASQLTLLSLLRDGAAILAAIGAALIVNARHLMYSAALAPTFQQQPPWFRWVGPYFLIDQVFALSLPRVHDDPAVFRVYYLTLGIMFWSLWLSATALGLVLGPVIPAAWQLEFAIPILFLGILVMTIDAWPKATAALVAAGVAFAAGSLPHKSGLLIGAFAGIATGFGLNALRR